MTADILISRLEGVIKAGSGWRSRCPAHDSKSASLAITETDTGSILVHCFAGCSVHDVLAAVGLQMADLFPERIKDLSPEGRRAAREALKRNGWAAALGVIARESTVIEVAAHDLAAGKALSVVDHDRLLVACDRIHGAREVLA
jgi:hypothetical protein